MFHLRSGSSTGKSGSSTQPTLFEVRLKSSHKNILIIKGSEYEAPSVFVSGNLVFSLPEKITVKKVSLKLIGSFKLDFMEVLTHHNRISASNPVKEVKTVLQCDWDNLLVNSEGVLKVGDYGDNTSSRRTSSGTSSSSSSSTAPVATGGLAGSSTNPVDKSNRSRMKRAGAPTMLQLPEASIHTTPFQNVMTPSGGNTFVLPKGNYELPFKCVLPGNIPETVEGLQSGSIFYKFEASLEKSASLLKSNHFVRHKYIRIFRTLSANNISLNEEVAIENTWPGRVQYEVSIPKKLIPVGGSSPVKILIIPLKKRLKLGKITASIIQHYVLKDSNEELYDHDQIIYDCELPEIPMHQLGDDRWDIHAHIQIPSDLKTVTQDCELREGLIKVRHKLKFKIQLVNEEDGHISELRAKLPINVYINPHYKVLARNIELDNSGKVHIKPGGITIFENGRGGSHTPGTSTPNGTASPNGTFSLSRAQSRAQSPSLDPIFDGGDDDMDDDEDEDESNNAPPLYEQHIYDQLYDALTGATSPPTSPRPIIARNTATSPTPGSGGGSSTGGLEPGSYFDITPGSLTPTHDLLNQYLTHQRSVRGRAGIGNPNVAEDEFISNIHSRSQTPGGLQGLQEHMSLLDLTTLSRVPSYDEALKGVDDDDSELAPLYDGDDDIGSDSSQSQLSLKPPKPAMTKSHSSGHVATISTSTSPPKSPLSKEISKNSGSNKKQPTGSQSYFDVSRNNSSNDLYQLGMTRPASVGNFSDLFQRRLAKKNGTNHSNLRNDK